MAFAGDLTALERHKSHRAVGPDTVALFDCLSRSDRFIFLVRGRRVRIACRRNEAFYKPVGRARGLDSLSRLRSFCRELGSKGLAAARDILLAGYSMSFPDIYVRANRLFAVQRLAL